MAQEVCGLLGSRESNMRVLLHRARLGVRAALDDLMILVMAMAGAGLFGMPFGLMAPIMTLALHIIYHVVLGLIFDRLVTPEVTYA